MAFTISDGANIVMSAATVVGLALIWLQLREARRSRRSEVTVSLIQEIGSEEQRALRRSVYNLSSDVANTSEDEQRQIELVCVSMSRAALLCAQGLADQATLLRMFAEAIVHTWKKAAPYIVAWRCQRGSTYLQSFEDLARQAETYLPPSALDKPSDGKQGKPEPVRNNKAYS